MPPAMLPFLVPTQSRAARTSLSAVSWRHFGLSDEWLAERDGKTRPLDMQGLIQDVTICTGAAVQLAEGFIALQVGIT